MDREYEKIKQFQLKHGGFISSKVELKATATSLGLYTKDAVSNGEVLFDLKLESCLRDATENKWPMEDISSKSKMTLSILEKLDQLEPFLRLMPEEIELPVTLPENEIKLLPRSIRGEVINQRKDITGLEWRINQYAKDETEVISTTKIMHAYCIALSKRITNHDFVAPAACFINHSTHTNVDVAIGDGKMKIIAKQKIPANLELTACYTKRPDSYFLVNYGALNGEKNLNCIELTCKQIIEIINDKVTYQKNEFNQALQAELNKWAMPRINQDCVIAPKPSVEYEFAITDIAAILCETPYFVHDKIMNTVRQQLEDAMYKARKELTKLALQSEIDMLKRVGNAFQKSF